jgi:hypothetical protein
MAFYISGPKLLFETTEISTQQESNYIYLYTTKFGTSIKIRLNQKFESTEFETMRVNCSWNQLNNWNKFFLPLTKVHYHQQKVDLDHRKTSTTNSRALIFDIFWWCKWWDTRHKHPGSFVLFYLDIFVQWSFCVWTVLKHF